MHKTSALAAACITLLGAIPLAYAQDSGNWQFRARATNFRSANGDTTGLGLQVNNKTFGAFDAAYFFGPNVALELNLTTPVKHTLSSNGSGIATLKQMPTHLMVQYHLTGVSALGGMRPYVGLGMNYTRFSSVNFEPAVVTALNPDIDRSATGFAMQLGADMPIGGGWLLNADLRKAQVRTDVSAGGNPAGTFKIDPLMLSLGVGVRF